MKMRILAAALVGLAAGCGGEAEEREAGPADAAAPAGEEAGARSIGDALAGSPDHARFMEAVEQAGLTETLRGAGPYTVFAPANAAFNAAAAGEGEGQVALIAGHIAPGAVTREDLIEAVRRNEAGRAELATLGGGTISVALDGDRLVLTDGAGTQAEIVEADGIRSNGVVHTIDAVLRPAG